MNPDSLQLPPQLTTNAAEYDSLYNFLYYFSLFFTVVITAAMLYFVVKYRRRPGVKPEPAGHALLLETAWTVLPLFFIIFLFHWGFKVFVKNAVAYEGSMEVRVRGQKWLWTFEYPNGYSEATELRIPVGKPVKLIMSSEDVIHSFFVPGARLKKDVVPGMYSTLSFVPTQVGDLQVYCAEYCGGAEGDPEAAKSSDPPQLRVAGLNKGHWGMIGVIHVMKQDEFDKWVANPPPPMCTEANGQQHECKPSEWGEKLYTKNGCGACHSVDGKALVGPSWKGLFGRQEVMTTGESVVADENYIKESILKPTSKIVKGYENGNMPPYTLSDRQIDALIAYMKTLK